MEMAVGSVEAKVVDSLDAVDRVDDKGGYPVNEGEPLSER